MKKFKNIDEAVEYIFSKESEENSMKELLNEIIESYQIYKKDYKSSRKGKGTVAYTTKRIDVLRDRLLDMKKDVLKYGGK